MRCSVRALARLAPRRALSDKAVAAMRLDHGGGGRVLSERDAGDAPLALFERWFDEAVAHPGVIEANAMALATVDAASAQPSCRVVLLKGYDARGLCWYTNYASRKAAELGGGGGAAADDGAAAARAALTFWWPALERQVRVEGGVARVSREETAAYFRSRPRASQIGAWASRQSSTVEGADALVARERALVARFDGRDVPVPDFWGGYRLRPRRFEFWQGRASRLHDRIAFEREDGDGDDGAWTRARLCP